MPVRSNAQLEFLDCTVQPVGKLKRWNIRLTFDAKISNSSGEITDQVKSVKNGALASSVYASKDVENRARHQ